jgi:AhpD family alkylhydroperoxidase
MPPFTKRTYTLRTLLRDALGVAGQARPLVEAYALHRVSPRLREKTWVAVSSVNECRYCLFVHGAWAEKVGVTHEELAELTGDAVFREGNAEAAATVYLQAWAERDFADVPAGIAAAFEGSYHPAAQTRLRALARMANLANRTGNTFDALLARLQGNPARDSSLGNEAAVSLVFLGAAAFVAPALAVAKRTTPWGLRREFRRKFTEQRPEAGQG